MLRLTYSSSYHNPSVPFYTSCEIIWFFFFDGWSNLNVVFIHLAEELISAETAEPRDPGNLLRAEAFFVKFKFT